MYGPSGGYFAKPTKSTIVLKKKHREQAAALFADLNVSVVLADHFLHGFTGNDEEVQSLL